MHIPGDDNLKIEYLSRMFDRNRVSNCYKYFWFLAILRKVSQDNRTFSYDDLITEMVADAWYMVAEYHLRLGPNNTTDNLEETVKYVYSDLNRERIPSTEKRELLVEYLKKLTDSKFLSFKRVLTDNVPYCLQTPFYDTKDRLLKNPSKSVIDRINQQSRLLYYFSAYNRLLTKITISDEWIDYLCRNREILTDWTRYNLIGYLQDRNPSVPGIADKILPPCSRKLEHAKEYWKVVIAADSSLTDIYGGNSLTDIAISIDHFVPWQYVAHDELWNLNPTTKSINSSKSNNLPDWNTYFGLLGELEYKAHELSFSDEKVKLAFEKCADYHVNNSEIRRALYSEQLERQEFLSRLDNVLRPVYESAKNCGFREWVYQNDGQ